MEAGTKSVLLTYFSGSFEKEVNGKMMYYSYSFEYERVLQYIDSLLLLSLEEFVRYLIDNYDVSYLEAKDVLQFSSFKDCTIGICRAFKEAGDTGYTFWEAGKLLENDGIQRKDGAYTKYGENHSKTAAELGLLHCLSNKYFLSCIGNVICELPEDKQEKLISRLLLRNKLIKKFIYRVNTIGSDSYEKEVSFLSKSTQIRRKSNIKQLINILSQSKEFDFSGLIKNIEF
jgi:hypothetical protein